MTRAWVAVLIVGAALASCVVTPVDPGCACSVDFPCRTGEQCVDGLCLLPNGTTACGTTVDGGRSDGGAGGTAGGSAGGTAGGAAGGTAGGSSGGTAGGSAGGSAGGAAGGTAGGSAGGTAGGTAGGSAGGSAGGAAGGTAGGSAGGTAGCPDAGSSMRWSQCRDGFAMVQTGVGSGGTATVGARNRLDITQTGNPTPDFGGGSGIEVPGRGFLPAGAQPQGSVRGTVRFDPLPTGTVSFAVVRVPDAGTDNLLDAFVWYDSMVPPGKMAMRLYCSPGRLLSTRLVDGGSASETEMAAGFILVDAGVDYDVTMRWELNQLCGLYLDGVPVSLRRAARNTVPLTEVPMLFDLRLGNVDYDNSGVNGPFQMSVQDWRYSDSVMGLQ